MALTPSDLATMRTRSLPPITELVKKAEQAIDAALREVFDPTKDICQISVSTSLLPSEVRAPLQSKYCGPGKWRSMEMSDRLYDVGSTDITFWRC